MKTVCPSCAAAIDTPYVMLGAGVTCPGCEQTVRPEIVPGVPLPSTGYEITFGDFVGLLIHKAYRPKVLPLVKKWAPSVETLTSGLKEIGAGSAEEKALLKIHSQIQGTGPMQFELYQTAMSLWR